MHLSSIIIHCEVTQNVTSIADLIGYQIYNLSKGIAGDIPRDMQVFLKLFFNIKGLNRSYHAS